MRCAVTNCNVNNKGKGFTLKKQFFRFPKDENVCSIWVNVCKRADTFNIKTSRICSLHFDKDSYVRNLKYELLGGTPIKQRLLKPNGIPTLNLPMEKLVNPERKKRLMKRNQRKLVEKILEPA